MQTLDSIEYQPIWLAPEHLAQTAEFVMKGHKIQQLAVVKNGAILGFVELDQVQKANPQAHLADILKPFSTVMDAKMTLRQAAAQFVREDISSAPVQSGDLFLGILTSNMMLKELFRSSDPLTGLSWVDLLREWGAAQLGNGVEVCVLAVDVDKFGKVNSAIGHRRADVLLQKLAGELASKISPQSDILVRAGGDKFLIGTTRPRAQLQQLGEEILAIVPSRLSEGLAIQIGVTVGIAGGRRTHERSAVHPESNIEDLINLALADARKKKIQPKAVVSTTLGTKSAENGPLELAEIHQSDSESPVIQLIVSWNHDRFEGESQPGQKSVGSAAAEAVLSALTKAMPETLIQLDAAYAFQDPNHTFVGSVEGTLEEQQIKTRFSGSYQAETQALATAKALLQAVNTALGLQVSST